MIAKKVTRYYTDCGRGFWNKKSAEHHEAVCKCWTNPKYKTCKTCKFADFVYDNNGMHTEPHLLHEYRIIVCNNPKFEYSKHFTMAHKNAEDLCINCPVWEKK